MHQTPIKKMATGYPGLKNKIAAGYQGLKARRRPMGPKPIVPKPKAKPMMPMIKPKPKPAGSSVPKPKYKPTGPMTGGPGVPFNAR